MSYLNEIYNFIEDYTGVYPKNPNVDIYEELGIIGNDFHELIENYSENYKVDMSGYLWYFHADEELFMNIGALFYKTPDQFVERIPVTPQILANCIETKKWDIKYPEHSIPKTRRDIKFSMRCLYICLGGMIAGVAYNVIWIIQHFK